MKHSDKELACMYMKLKQKIQYYKERQSFYDHNKYLESKRNCAIIKMEMKKRDLKKKKTKKLSNC